MACKLYLKYKCTYVHTHTYTHHISVKEKWFLYTVLLALQRNKLNAL